MITRALSLLASAAACGLTIASASYAQAAPERITALVERLDLNDDGGIDAGEVEQARAEAFTSMDVNADGFVEKSETEELIDAAGLAPQGGERPGRFARGDRDPFARLDTNGDGMVSREEYMAQPVRILKADENGDGVVTAAEIEAMAGALRERFGGRLQE